MTDLEPLRPPDATSNATIHRSAWVLAARVSLWLLVVVLILSGWLLVGTTVAAEGRGPIQLVVGVAIVVAAVALFLELRRRRSFVRVVLASVLAITAAPFVFVGVLLLVIYPAAAALRGL